MLRKITSVLMICSIFSMLLTFDSLAASSIEVWTEDSLVEITSTALLPSGASTDIDIVAAKNEYESYQIALRGDSPFTIQSVSFSDLVNGAQTISHTNFQHHYELFYDGTDGFRQLGGGSINDLYPLSIYPDPLSNDETIDVAANHTQPIWLNFYIPKATTAGSYTGTVTVTTTMGAFTFDVTAQVCDVTIPDTKDSTFKMYNWSETNAYSLEADFDIGKPFYNIDKYSPEWWTLMGNLAEQMVKNRQNTVIVWAVNLLHDAGSTVDANGNVTFNWSLFDQFIDTFKAKGITHFGGGHLAFHWSGTPGSYPNGEQIIRLARDANGNTILTGSEIPSTETDQWMAQFLPALKEHLVAKGLLDNWYQHVYDEPGTKSKWAYLADKVHTLAPGMKTMDADGGGLASYASKVDVWVPLENAYEDNKSFYNQQKALGKEVFTYTCLAPSPPYLNRLCEQPNLTNQLLFWYSFKNKLDGYLHWGWNCWGYGRLVNYLGDTCIVYPDPERLTVKSSVRNEIQRDGLEDQELLKILTQTNANLADLYGKSLITNATIYSTDIVYIRKIRSDMVRAAAGEDVVPLILVNNTDSHIQYNGQSWGYDENRQYIDNINKDVQYCTSNDDYLEYTFKGTGIDVIGEHMDHYGEVDIYMDNVFQETISCFGTSNRNGQYIVYSKDNLPYGSHTIKMIKKSGSYMILDAFMVRGQKSAINVALNKPVTVNNVYQNMAIHTGDKINDGDASTRWATDAGITECWVEIDFGTPTTFNKTMFTEWKADGDRIDSFKIQYHDGANWVDVSTGNQAAIRQENTFNAVTSNKVRLVLTDVEQKGPTIYEFEVYHE